MKTPVTEYVVPKARLHYFAPKSDDDFNGMAHKDETYPRPCDWIAANAARFYFTNKQIIEAALPDLVEPDCNPHHRLRLIYFLILDGEIVYVGQSSCAEKRIMQHRDSGLKFDSVTWFEAPAMHLDDIEAYYIWRCNPIRNNKWPRYGEFGEAAKLLDKQHGEKRNDAVYVISISARSGVGL